MAKVFEVPPTVCPRCKGPLLEAVPVKGWSGADRAPRPGDPALCFWCREALCLTVGGGVRLATDADVETVPLGMRPIFRAALRRRGH